MFPVQAQAGEGLEQTPEPPRCLLAPASLGYSRGTGIGVFL